MLSEGERYLFYTNDLVENRKRVLITGDSYLHGLMDDFGQSYYEAIYIWGDYLWWYEEILEEGKPDIVVIGCGECVDRIGAIIALGKSLTN